MRWRKKHVVGMFIFLLIIPTIVFFNGKLDCLILLLVISEEACMGISLFLLRDDAMSKRKFLLGLSVVVLTGFILIAVLATFPYWIFHVMGWRLP
jgi:hypothetical protein